MVTDPEDGWDDGGVRFWDPHDAGPGDAGPLPAGARSHRGDDGRPELLRVPEGTIDGRRHRAMPHRPEQPGRCPLDLRGGHQVVLRPDQPRMVDGSYPDG